MYEQKVNTKLVTNNLKMQVDRLFFLKIYYLENILAT